MKRIILILSIFICASCIVSCDENMYATNIDEALTKAKTDIKACTNTEIIRAKKEISNEVANVISKADTTLTSKFKEVEKSLNNKAEETSKKVERKISSTKKQIERAELIGYIGIITGLLGIVFAIFIYRKRSIEENMTKLKIYEEITELRNEINKKHNEIKHFYELTTKAKSQYPSSQITQNQIERIVEKYMNEKYSKGPVQASTNTCISTEINKKEPNLPKVEAKNVTDRSTTAKREFYLFAKDSRTTILSNVNDCYQKGKTVFKLSMEDANATSADVSICIEQEDLRQRILTYDSQYLEPICEVTRTSTEPCEIIIKSKGIAERIGEDWNVTKPVIIEIK